MDILDVMGVGADLKGRIGRAFGVAGALLIYGWSQHWPVAHPLVQAALDGRAQQLTDAVLSAVGGGQSG